MGLADGTGAWWFRYLLMNPGRAGCDGMDLGAPVQVWATYFPKGGGAQTFIEGFRPENLAVSARGEQPFRFAAGETGIDDNSCHGHLDVNGHDVAWNLRYDSRFRTVLSHKGWIGFSQTPHSDAVFDGEVRFDGHTLQGTPVGYGVQGHNCGYRHRDFWTWTHAFFLRPGKSPSTLEALEYEMPFGMRFRKAVLWHDEREHVFRTLEERRRDRKSLQWDFVCASDGSQLSASVDGSGIGVHGLPYLKTNCSGTFEVRNNSLANATITLRSADGATEILETTGGAVLEMAG